MAEAQKASLTDNVVALMNGYAAIEAAKNSSFSTGGSVSAASAQTPMVDYQNKGEPTSPQIVNKTYQPLAGDEHKGTVAMNKKNLLIGGGVLLTLAVVFVALDK